MDWNALLFVVFPYVAVAIFLVVTVYRSVYRPFTVSSLSSQLLERRQLYWGSIPFHWGIILILLLHLLALLFPRGLTLWNSVPVRLYLLEASGLAMGLWALIGLLVLSWRRVVNRRVQAVSTWMDYVLLIFLLLSVVTGVTTAVFYRFGSYWYTAIFTPYLVSLFTLKPQPNLVAPLPLVVQLHVLNFFILLLIFPFSRMVHILTYPLGYLLRPWQIVIWARRRQKPAS